MTFMIKTLIILFLSAFCVSAQNTTNTYTATVVKGGKVKINTPCGTIWSDGRALWKNNIGGTWFSRGTNTWFQLTFTNNLPIIQWDDKLGNAGCGLGTLTVTDTSLVGVSFDVLWPTNLAIPTNPIPMVVVNLINTNTP